MRYAVGVMSAFSRILMKPYEGQVDLDPLVATEPFELGPVASVYLESAVQSHIGNL